MGSSGKRSPARRGRGERSWKDSGLVWFGGAAVLLGLFILPTLSLGTRGRHHPDPRPMSQRARTAPAAEYAAYPRVAQIYGEVAQVAEVVDGVYCYCNCEEHAGHYSLLDCFHNDHASQCDICLSEGDMVYRMHRAGKSLDQIRSAIDHLYST